MSKKDIKVGDMVVYRNMLSADMYAIVESVNKYGGLRCRLCEPITHIEAAPEQLELATEEKVIGSVSKKPDGYIKEQFEEKLKGLIADGWPDVILVGFLWGFGFAQTVIESRSDK
jgi:hypothetical protein